LAADSRRLGVAGAAVQKREETAKLGELVVVAWTTNKAREYAHKTAQRPATNPTKGRKRATQAPRQQKQRRKRTRKKTAKTNNRGNLGLRRSLNYNTAINQRTLQQTTSKVLLRTSQHTTTTDQRQQRPKTKSNNNADYSATRQQRDSRYQSITLHPTYLDDDEYSKAKERCNEGSERSETKSTNEVNEVNEGS